VFWNQLLTLFNSIAVWWNVLGVAVIVVILIPFQAITRASRYVFGHTINNSGFGHHMYWYYVLPIGFLLTMYTITGYDASAHVSEETHGAAEAAAKGVWKSVFYSAVVGYIVLLALTFATTKTGAKGEATTSTVIPILTAALSVVGAKAVIFISVVGQLFCGLPA
jgi:hypothetical protein